MTSSRAFARTASRTVFEGHVITVAVDTIRFDADGVEVEREVVHHPGAVAVVAVDATHVHLVRQPRPAVDDPDCLELPAGLLDVDGEPPAAAAARELAEEIGKAAARWTPLHAYHSSVGTFDETVHLFLAEELTDVPRPDAGEDERIELVAWPLADLDALIAQMTDAKTLIGLLLLRDRRRGAPAA